MLVSPIRLDPSNSTHHRTGVSPVSPPHHSPFFFLTNLQRLLGLHKKENSPVSLVAQCPLQNTLDPLDALDAPCFINIHIRPTNSPNHLRETANECQCFTLQCQDPYGKDTEKGCCMTFKPRSPTDFTLSSSTLSGILCYHYVECKTVTSTWPRSSAVLPLSNELSRLETMYVKEKTRFNDHTKAPVTPSHPSHPKKIYAKRILDATNTILYVRDVRANSGHLRTLVAEVNMMRVKKIVGPLRPRHVLPKRTDTFVANTASPLFSLIE